MQQSLLQECATMVPRYSLPEMAAVWSVEHRFELWKQVESLALAAWEDLGVVPAGTADAVRAAETPSADAVHDRELVTNHDMAAFVDLLADGTDVGAEWVHFGLTSSDVLDTAGGVQLAEATDLLIAGVKTLFEVVRAKAFEHRTTPIVGRTHGIWAEPTSLGLKLATWAFELARAHERLLGARTRVAVGKISGAVGTYAHCPPSIERYVCEQLGLSAEPASSQVVHRDRHAELLVVLAVIGGGIERFATEIRHLQRSEVGEVRESFGYGQKGSSAMPHKRNPILSERMTGMARLLRGYAATALENIALWHERDISHSSAERVILPDACLTLHYMLTRFTELITHLEMDEERMLKNLESTGGLVASQAILLALVEEGASRDDAYRIVQRNALTSLDSGTPLIELLGADVEVTLEPDQLEALFAPDRFLRHSGVVFDRLADVQLAKT